MKVVMEQAFPFYQLDDVDLKGGDAEIPRDLSGVIITQPGKDYSSRSSVASTSF